MALTREDVKTLNSAFPRAAHEFMQGLVYITEQAVTERIEEVDPSWRFEVVRIEHVFEQCIVHVRLTVKDVVREGVGMQKVVEKAGEPAKGAATDALKRAARLFGVGRYLLDNPPKEGKAFDEWLAQQQKALNGAQKPATPQLSQQPAPQAAAPHAGGQTSPLAVTPPTSPMSGGASPDKLAQTFPAASKWTSAMLSDRTDTYFDHPAHFKAHWEKHEAEYAGKTLEEAVALVHTLHWNYDKAQCDKLKAFGVNILALTPNEILAALADANGHSVKRWKDWDGGIFTVAQGALLAWKSNYGAQAICDNAENMEIGADVVHTALTIGEMYRSEHAEVAVSS